MHTRPHEAPKGATGKSKHARKIRATVRARGHVLAAPERTAPTRPDDGEAFLHDPGSGPAHTEEQLAETLAEEYLQSATAAQEVSEDVRDAIVPEELGGPFLQATAEEEFADDVDEMNPPDAERAPFPTAVRLER